MTQKAAPICIVIVALCVALACAARAQNSQVSVVVQDEENQGVVSTVFIRSPTHIDARLRDTEPDGHLNVGYSCHIGETLWAQPKDSVRYFNSKVTDCQSKVTLLVIRKQSPVGQWDGVIIRTLDTDTNGQSGQRIFITKWLVQAQAQPVNPPTSSLVPTPNRQGCAIEFVPNIVTSVFTRTKDGQLDKVDEIRSSPANDANLTTEKNTYNESCSQAAESIGKSKIEWLNKSAAYISRIYTGAPPYPDATGGQYLIQKYFNPS
jgi:hypothetical protein